MQGTGPGRSGAFWGGPPLPNQAPFPASCSGRGVGSRGVGFEGNGGNAQALQRTYQVSSSLAEVGG